MKRSTVLSFLLTLAALLVIPVSSRLLVHRDAVPEQRDSTFRCLVALEGVAPRSLEVRLNESMLRKFADDMHIPAQVRVVRKGENAVDSLRNGSVDLVVAFAADSLNGDGLLSSRPFGDSTVWVIRNAEIPGRRMRGINDWLTRRNASAYVRRVTRDFLGGKAVSLTSISPYDDIIQRNSAAMGWDWRLISALIYHESRFINESASDRGAVGLMQIVTERVSVDSLLDPAAAKQPVVARTVRNPAPQTSCTFPASSGCLPGWPPIRRKTPSSPSPPSMRGRAASWTASASPNRRASIPPTGKTSSPSCRKCPASAAPRPSPTSAV